MKQFISVKDAGDIQSLIAKARSYKANPYSMDSLGARKKLGLLFLNPSLRTRISTQVAAKNLGMESIVFNADKDGWALEFEDDVIMNGNTVEHIRDAAPVLGSYFDILAIRVFPGLKNREEDYSEFILKQFIKYAGIPVISLESATLHPLQSLADLVTITETCELKQLSKPKVVLSWAPHIKALPQCVANSFAQWMTAWNNADFYITHPEGYELSSEFTTGATILTNQEEALKDADFVYVKNWSSFSDYGAMPGQHHHWLLNPDKMALTNHAAIMHCLPVRRNLELPSYLLDSEASLVLQQAENRVWSAQAVIASILQSL